MLLWKISNQMISLDYYHPWSETCQFWPMKRCRLVSVVKTCFDHVLSGFSWERILFLNSACVNMVMQIQVQIGDTRRVFYDSTWECWRFKKTTFCVRFRRHVLWILVYFAKTIKENMYVSITLFGPRPNNKWWEHRFSGPDLVSSLPRVIVFSAETTENRNYNRACRMGSPVTRFRAYCVRMTSSHLPFLLPMPFLFSFPTAPWSLSRLFLCALSNNTCSNAFYYAGWRSQPAS